MVGGAFAQGDIYDPATNRLTIASVLNSNNGMLYSDVVVTVGDLFSVGSCSVDSRRTYDQFDATHNRLTITKGVKKDGSSDFFNVIISIKEVLSVGSTSCFAYGSNSQVVTGTSFCTAAIFNNNIDPCSNPTWFIKSGLLPDFSILWDKYSWNKPYIASDVYTVASQKFKDYVASVRSPDAYVQVVSQSGVATNFLYWVKQGGNFVAKAFSYPPLPKPLIEVVAIDRNFYYQTLIENNLEVTGNLFAWDGGAPAWGGTIMNSYNYSVVSKLLDSDKSGMAQTPGHEYFHAVQQNIVGAGPGVQGEKIPNWFWEGGGMFVGLQTSDSLGFSDYVTVGRRSQVSRCMTANMQKLKLSESNANLPGIVDPYGIGEIATELLIANIGMEKYMNIYAQLKLTNQNFPIAFLNATGVRLEDFYAMFEESRAVLGCKKI